MLGQRLRRCPSTQPALAQRLVFAGEVPCSSLNVNDDYRWAMQHFYNRPLEYEREYI